MVSLKVKPAELHFISDTHFGHEGVIRYSQRPFKSVEEMDAELIERWNAVVKPDDTVIHCGDFAFAKPLRICQIVTALRGRIHLVLGNHDDMLAKRKDVASCFASVNRMLQITAGEQRIVACHYAMRVWNRSHHGAWHVYGHSHGTLPYLEDSLSMDVGVDASRLYRPLSFAEIAKRMSEKKWAPVDMHGRELPGAE